MFVCVKKSKKCIEDSIFYECSFHCLCPKRDALPKIKQETGTAKP